MEQEYISHSPEETEAFAEKIAANLLPGDTVAFFGPLGMGKTCFTRGLCRGLGFKGDVNSPTFSLVNEYIGGRLSVYHFDMYRIETWEDLYTSGYFDYLMQDGVTVIEWSENIENALPDKYISISFEKQDESTRKITVDWGDKNENAVI